MCPYVCMYVCTICTSIFHHSIIFRMGSLDFVICFAWSWETISTQNWWSRIFWENYYLPKKGPKWPNLYIFLFLWRFYQNWYVIFFIFCMKLRNHKHSKLKKPNFYGKFLLTQNQAKRAQNGTIFSFVCYNCTFLRIDSLVFFGILYDAGDLKTDAAKFLGKILTCAKSGQKDPKCSYLSVHCGCIFFSGLAH